VTAARLAFPGHQWGRMIACLLPFFVVDFLRKDNELADSDSCIKTQKMDCSGLELREIWRSKELPVFCQQCDLQTESKRSQS